MKQQEFLRLFPHADMHKFKPDYDGTMVFVNNDNLVDVESTAFFDDYKNIKYLNLPNVGLGWWRDDHYNFLDEWRRAYKYRGLKDDDLFPLKYNVQTKTPWGPKEWDSRKNYDVPVIPKSFLVPGKLFSGPPTIDVNLENFRIYVNDSQFFMMNKKLPWNFTNITKVNFDDMKNEYCLSLSSMYVLSYLGGMSLKNLNSDNPLAKSLAHFYFFYHLNKFYNYRDFSIYNVSELKKHSWPLYTTKVLTQIHDRLVVVKKDLNNPDDTKTHIGSKGVWFGDVRKKRNLTKDYLNLLLVSSSGISNIGQQLLQESCQAYVYCVLGAQAKTRWKIVGDSANSLQTQRVFYDLVSEVTKQNNISTLIKSMRTAIADTRVRLDFCISPGLELLPSNMVFIKDTPGYNNILIVSTRSQKFGMNNVNTKLKLVDDNLQDNLQQPTRTPERTPTREPTRALQTKFEQDLNKNQAKFNEPTRDLQGYFKDTSHEPTKTPTKTPHKTLGSNLDGLNKQLDNLGDNLNRTGLFVITAIVVIPILYFYK